MSLSGGCPPFAVTRQSSKLADCLVGYAHLAGQVAQGAAVLRADPGDELGVFTWPKRSGWRHLKHDDITDSLPVGGPIPVASAGGSKCQDFGLWSQFHDPIFVNRRPAEQDPSISSATTPTASQ